MTTTAIQKKPTETAIEYAAFGSNETVKLSCSIIRSYIAVPTKNGNVATDRDCMKFMALCKARALNPFEGDAFMLGYDTKDGPQFSLITAHQAFIKRAEAAPEYDGMESGIVVKTTEDGAITERVGDLRYDGETLLGGWAVVYSKQKSHPMKKVLDVRKFAKPYGVWQTNPEGMIVKCAEADALRSSFPNRLGGCYLREEMEDPNKLSRAPIAEPMALPTASEITPPPAEQPPEATQPPQGDAGTGKTESGQPPPATEGTLEVRGILDMALIKKGKNSGKPYYSIQIGGEWHNTFDKAMFDHAEIIKGREVVGTYAASGDQGQYRNLLTLAEVE